MSHQDIVYLAETEESVQLCRNHVDTVLNPLDLITGKDEACAKSKYKCKAQLFWTEFSVEVQSELTGFTKMSEGQSGYVFVCADEYSRSDGVELPTEEDGTLLLSVLQSQFESASGLKYR